MKTHSDSKKAFSLIELMAVITILSVLLVLGVGAIRGTKESSKKAQCAANLKQIGLALFAYAADHQQKLPFIEGKVPYGAPVTLALHLVGNRGAAGYLPWNGDISTSMWTEAMMCPGDPNRAFYQKTYGYGGSYVYRANEEAGDVSQKAISLTSKRAEQQGYRRWIVADRGELGAATIIKPNPGGRKSHSTPAGRWEPDRRGYASYWHVGNGCNVLYEDGSVTFRSINDPIGL